MALTSFPSVIRVTLGSSWTGRFGLSPGTILDLVQGSTSGVSTQWTEDTQGSTIFNKTTNRILVTFDNNLNIANNGPPNYTPTGTYGTARIAVYAGREGYTSPSFALTPFRKNWIATQKQYTFNGFTITNYVFKELFNASASTTNGPNASISGPNFSGTAGFSSSDAGQNFTTSIARIPVNVFTTMELAGIAKRSMVVVA